MVGLPRATVRTLKFKKLNKPKKPFNNLKNLKTSSEKANSFNFTSPFTPWGLKLLQSELFRIVISFLQHVVKISANSEMVEREPLLKFVELSWNDPIDLDED